MTDATRRFRLVAGIVLGHVVVNLAHGLPHAEIPVELAPWQNGFVAIVVIALPIGGLWLLGRGRVHAGAAALLVGGLGAAAFGTYYHFFSATPDNVARVTGPWSGYFLLTSLAISVLAIAVALTGAWLLAYHRDAED